MTLRRIMQSSLAQQARAARKVLNQSPVRAVKRYIEIVGKGDKFAIVSRTARFSRQAKYLGGVDGKFAPMKQLLRLGLDGLSAGQSEPLNTSLGGQHIAQFTAP